MDPHHLDIVRLAWSRELGLADDALTDRPGRATRADPEADTLRFLDLRGTTAMVGPDWILRRAERLSDRDLTEPATLLALVQDRSGRCSGPLTLWFTSDYQEPATGRPPVVSDDRGHVRELETACPPDDVTEAHLSTRDRWFTILDDAQQPVSSAGYSEFQGFVADVAVLTAPLFRCRGLGTQAAGIATDDALDSGLIAQFRAPRDAPASRRLAARSGYRELGTYIEVTVARSTL
ncbi:GNAT family N-acetyltransferase [Rhodococcus oxybenzonivorans]|uniref:GNAT family N-acetyltransferase n=1 Tax=Rhodococcus oxybenzonivorans TaxID=1990687 RepID=A0A2S2BYG9_9NOCA|nr:GNAT family N-acetyltransferase [Rhodococcus oxybenzonivorans]AWK73619.1 GNAT family N-acetyltransferase [Rhodococcus oxybenzonivorans]